MNEDAFIERVHQIIQSAVRRAGGNWKQSFQKEVGQILANVRAIVAGERNLQ